MPKGYPTRWLIVGDSLTLPRPGVPYESTWPYILQHAMPNHDFINRGIRSSTTHRLGTEGDQGGDCLEFYQPDYVILQLGICDCAPRAFSHKSLFGKIVRNLPNSIGKNIALFKVKLFGRSMANAWVPLSEFRQNLEAFILRCKQAGATLIAIGIMPVGKSIILKNPLISELRNIYNEAMKASIKDAGFFYLESFPDELVDSLTLDGYHPNTTGNAWIASHMQTLIQDMHISQDAN